MTNAEVTSAAQRYLPALELSARYRHDWLLSAVLADLALGRS